MVHSFFVICMDESCSFTFLQSYSPGNSNFETSLYNHSYYNSKGTLINKMSFSIKLCWFSWPFILLSYLHLSPPCAEQEAATWASLENHRSWKIEQETQFRCFIMCLSDRNVTLKQIKCCVVLNIEYDHDGTLLLLLTHSHNSCGQGSLSLKQN